MEVIENELPELNLECINILKVDISFTEVVAKCPPVLQIMKPVSIDQLMSFEKYRNPEKEFELLKVICESVRHKQTLVSFVNKLNRYTDIKALEHTLVTLGGQEESLLDKYIHANYIVNPFKGGRPDFIATQGPLPTTFYHFWKMIDREGSSIIIMLCSLVEGGRKKCYLYWPGEKNSSTVIQKEYEVALKEENKQLEEFSVIRNIELKKIEKGEVRQIKQIQVVGWPDNEIPTENDLPHLFKLVEEVVEGQPDRAPIVVHCSAGVGRTGTFIALFYLRKLIVALRRTGDLRAVSIFGLVRNLKEQRFGMINKSSQYRLLYIAAAYWLSSA